MNTLTERAVLMRLSIGLPGENRGDSGMTTEVVRDHNLGSEAGKWMKRLFPPEALADIKKLDNEARAYHAEVTLPWDAGVGILPAALIMDHADKMREFKSKREVLIEKFLADPQRWINWASEQHNGTFDPAQYPGVSEGGPQSSWKWVVDVETFQSAMRKKFTFRSAPMPVPQSEHFCDTVASLMGTDRESVDRQVSDAAMEAQRELMRRLMAPVAAMAAKLSEQPKIKDDGTPARDIVFRDSLVGNLQDITRIAPALNLGSDPVIDGFIAEVEGLARYSPDVLREDKASRDEAAKKADALAKKMADYKF